MNDRVAVLLIKDVHREFQNQRNLAQRAIVQLSPRELFHTLDEESNSVAVIMKHVGGNLRSRWTDFLSSDGEKPDRNRDGEFMTDGESPESVNEIWLAGWLALDRALQALQPADLLATVQIRGETVPVIQAINRSLAHTAQHVGQIILLAKHLRSAAWQTLSIPRGRSTEFLTRPPA